MYRIGDEVKLQQAGGPVGLRFTGMLARTVMAKVRKLIIEQFTRWGIPLYLLSKYVDDCTNVMRLLRVGTT